jgi:hypothetical protein
LPKNFTNVNTALLNKWQTEALQSKQKYTKLPHYHPWAKEELSGTTNGTGHLDVVQNKLILGNSEKVFYVIF